MIPKENQVQHKKKFFLTGAPSSGKTTVIKKLIKLLPMSIQGFYTEEERIDGKRMGFLMHALDGKQGYLAHQDIISERSIRRYGVSIKNIDEIAVQAIMPKKNHVIIIDEIGKMECFSDNFMEAAKAALDAPNIVVGTITLGGTDFILEVKQRSDVEIVEVTLDNRELLPEILAKRVNEQYNK